MSACEHNISSISSSRQEVSENSGQMQRASSNAEKAEINWH
jgi:hypothetical protein